MRLRPVLFALLLAPCSLASQIRPPSASPPPRGGRAIVPAEPGSDLTVYLMTMGVGDDIWEKFGHNAIWLHLDRSPSAGGVVDAIYNWGIFDFHQPNFIARFLKGRMLYSMGGYTLESTMEQYRQLDRSVSVQELDLTNPQKAALRDFLLWNARPENASYYYDYYRDNCSTRVRDALDRVLGGLIRATFAGRPSGHSYRWHTMRLTQSAAALAAGMDLGLGRPADREISAHEEMFLPAKLEQAVRELRITGADGATRPLVRSESTLYVSTRYREPAAPPHWTPSFLAVGLILALIFALVGWKIGPWESAQGARYASAILFSLWSVVAGVLGLLLTLLWTVTHHVFAHRNENLLLFHPLWLVLAVLLPIAAGTGRFSTATRRLVWLCAGLACVAPLLHVIGLSRQSNSEIIALALPPILALAWAVHRGTIRGYRGVPSSRGGHG